MIISMIKTFSKTNKHIIMGGVKFPISLGNIIFEIEMNIFITITKLTNI
jgi:hypothetical protein